MTPSIPFVLKFPNTASSTPSTSSDSTSQTLSPPPPSPTVPQPSSSDYLIPIFGIHINLPID